MQQMRAFAIALSLLVAAPALALHPPSDDQVRQSIVQESVAAYLATGQPCPCPYSSDRAGHSCGGRSAYSRPGGVQPMCYPADVPDGMVKDWRRLHQ
jgi:hypothetical protein